MPVDEAIKLWRSHGKPIIHLGPGENCFDLEKLLAGPLLNRDHLESVRTWLDRVSNAKEV